MNVYTIYIYMMEMCCMYTKIASLHRSKNVHEKERELRQIVLK